MARHSKHQEPQSLEIERLVPSSVPWYRKRMITEHLQRYTFATRYSKGVSVGDIACGVGYGSFAIAKYAKQVYGIDSSPEAIHYAKQHYSKKNITFITTDAAHTSLRTNLLDVVVSFETIEHLKDPDTFLKEVNRILTDKGMLILSTPNKTFSVGTNHFHYYEYTYEELLATLKKHFSSVTMYGQREIAVTMFTLLQLLSQRFPPLTFLLPFRFWERIVIKKLGHNNKKNYMYFIAVCKK